MAKIYPFEALQANLKDKAMHPNHPVARGAGFRPDTFFQINLAAKPFYDACPQKIIEAMAAVESITGRKYEPYMYYGHPQANRLLVLMGSAAQTSMQMVDYLVDSQNEKVGLINVHMYRPWSSELFLSKVPKTVKKVTVLDKTDEAGSHGNPLYLDVVTSFADQDQIKVEKFCGGVYGLSGKDCPPAVIRSVFDNMKLLDPKRRFTLGVIDDVSNSSLPTA
eukprot:CAMPEP_0201281722 /NCGR_PEP_ID=MMETSP1317-20130820/3905_1 /ASSEMBLY_ACC=CAM_ASM_000770 /TAXON_ID=187299 /ORGANISM="Undescribed Undescribed, Strain Undescribed" /LENGTH=220 /DNA_ID=CAMNT_0047592439 /DNA_START=719 /DNA_END=1381 /DNA_ORIENTATION=-